MKKTILFISGMLLATQVFAQLRPGMPRHDQPAPYPGHLVPGPKINPPLMPHQPPLRPVPPISDGKIAQAVIRMQLSHGQTIGVRRVMNDLLHGDFVKSLQVFAQAQQRGAYLEVIMDNTVIANLPLNSNLTSAMVEIRKLNGIDYQRLMLRSIGATYVDSILAKIGEDIAPIPDEPMPPLPNDPNDPGNTYPDPNNPPQPIYPPHQGSLYGYCEDYDRSQFSAAKNFAYSGSGLDLSSNDAVEWALRYNQTHACGTIQEYQSRFSILKNFAYSGSGLDMNSRDAVNYALSKVETTTVAQAQQMQATLSAIKNFAYSGSGLDLSSSEASSLGRQWIDRGYCEGPERIQQLAAQYRTEYNFAYSGSGLNYDSARAKQYAISRIRHMTSCGDLLR